MGLTMIPGRNISVQRLLKWPGTIFYGWWIVAVGFILDALKQGTFTLGFATYFLPIQRELELSRTATSFAFTLGRLEGGLQGPLIGYLIDHLGPKLMMVVGAVLAGVGFILLSFTQGYWFFLLVFVGLLSVGFRSGFDHSSMAAVNRWFFRKKGLAMSMVTMGHGLGGAIIAPVIGIVVYHLGWRAAALYSGIAILGIAIPLSLLVRRSPEDFGLLPDGEPMRPRPLRSPAHHPGPSSSTSDFTTGEALKTRAFWQFVLAVGFRNAADTGIIVHLIPILVWKGLDERSGAWLLGLLAFTTFFLRPTVGWIGDRWSKSKISAIGMMIGGLGVVWLVYSDGHLWQLAIFAILLGCAESINAVGWAILGGFFGRKNFATLRGWGTVTDQFLAMGSPVFLGWVFDRTQSYFWALLPLLAIFALSAFFYWTLPEPKSRPSPFRT